MLGRLRPSSILAVSLILLGIVSSAATYFPKAAYCLPHSSPKDLSLRLHAGKTWTISYVHTVKNLSPLPMERVEVAVAVPHSDEHQAVHSVQFDPKPVKVSSDGWEQETAHFVIQRIAPRGEARICLTASVTLREIEWLITERDVGSRKEIPDRVVQHYLRDGENYNLHREILRRAAKSLQMPGENMLQQVRRVHDFVMDSMEYDRDDRWEPANEVLESGRGSCSEYSYLMIALCRLNGIPARYVGGTWLQSPPGSLAPVEPGPLEVDHVFHRWVEVYLPRVGWFPVDPTQDDAAEREGEPYRYFGRLPWFYLAMARGDGDPLESGLLGWEYRSSMRWLRQETFPKKGVQVDRCAIWKEPPGDSIAVVKRADASFQ